MCFNNRGHHVCNQMDAKVREISECCIDQPTYSRHHSSNKIKSPCKIPSWSQSISPDPGGDGSLVLPQEGVEVLQADVEGLTEVEERPIPAAVSPQLRGPLYGREDRSAAQQVQYDEEGEQHETAVVLVEVQGAAALQSLGSHHPNFSTTRASDSDKLHIGDGSHSSANVPWKSLSCSLTALLQATFPPVCPPRCPMVVVKWFHVELSGRKTRPLVDIRQIHGEFMGTADGAQFRDTFPLTVVPMQLVWSGLQLKSNRTRGTLLCANASSGSSILWVPCTEMFPRWRSKFCKLCLCAGKKTKKPVPVLK